MLVAVVAVAVLILLEVPVLVALVAAEQAQKARTYLAQTAHLALAVAAAVLVQADRQAHHRVIRAATVALAL